MKITRGYFNRKILFFGLLGFVAISLISTGFATWIMSTGSAKAEKGNVSVGTITDGSLEFGEITFENGVDSIIFDSDEEDTEGDIKASTGKNAVYENLSVKFTTTISPKEYLDDLSISIVIPDTVKNAAGEGYITLPSCCYIDGNSATPVSLVVDGVVQDEPEKNETGIEWEITDNGMGGYSITCKINFGWGKNFNYTNPGIYLDGESLGLTYEEKRNMLIDFKCSIYGLNKTNHTEDEILSYNAQLGFEVKLNATSN